MFEQTSLKHSGRRDVRDRIDFDRRLMHSVAAGDERAVATFIDRWMSSLYQVTDGLRMTVADADVVVEEVFRRVMFDAPRFVARPEKFVGWLRATVRDCAAAVIARQRTAPAASARSAEDPMRIQVTSQAGLKFCSLLNEKRLPDAIGYLNSLTPYRFTGVYRFDGIALNNVHLFDRESGFGCDGSVSRVSDTYCLWIQETLAVVQMSDSFADPRAIGHAKREIVRSYCGGPIRSDTGDLVGTICHFDYQPRETAFDMLSVLEEVAPRLAATFAMASSLV